MCNKIRFCRKSHIERRNIVANINSYLHMLVIYRNFNSFIAVNKRR